MPDAPPPPSVLVVDADPRERQLVLRALVPRNYDVRAVATREEADSAITGHRPRLAIVSMAVPGADDLVRTLKSGYPEPEILVLALTAAGAPFPALCDGALSGPIVADDIDQAVSRHLGREIATIARGTRPPTKSRPRVLIVDDDQLVSLVLKRTLIDTYDIVVANDGHEALALIQHGLSFDVIICDVRMPTMPGPKLFAALLQISPRHAERMLFLTGDVFSPTTRTFLSNVPNAHLEKPYSLEELRTLVAAIALGVDS